MRQSFLFLKPQRLKKSVMCTLMSRIVCKGEELERYADNVHCGNPHSDSSVFASARNKPGHRAVRDGEHGCLVSTKSVCTQLWLEVPDHHTAVVRARNELQHTKVGERERETDIQTDKQKCRYSDSLFQYMIAETVMHFT